MKIVWYMTEIPVCSIIRAEYIADELHRQYPKVSIDLKKMPVMSDVQRADLMIFQRPDSDGYFQFMRHAQGKGIPCVLDTDDDMLSCPEGVGSISEHFRSEPVREAIRKCFQYADGVIVPSTGLARAVQQYCQAKVYLVPNYLDCEAWELAECERRVTVRDNIIVGWTTSPVHIIDAPEVSVAIKRVLDDLPAVNFLAMGSVGPEDFGDWLKAEAYKERVRFVPTVPMTHLPGVMKNLDIGIAPLKKIPYNDGRSNIKWQQYSVLGIPCIAQKSIVYGNIREGVDGFLAETADEWYGKIKALAESKELRDRVGTMARLEVLAKWDLRKMAGRWMDVFAHILATVGERKR